MVYKQKYQNRVIFVKGYGQIDTKKVSVETIYQLSLQPKYVNLINLLENEKTDTNKGKSKSV
jgi:hypothetical protein